LTAGKEVLTEVHRRRRVGPLVFGVGGLARGLLFARPVASALSLPDRSPR
jgi:hypothetical protein